MFPQISHFDPEQAIVPGAPVTERRLSDLRGVFADAAAYEAALAQGDPVLYRVYPVEPAQGEGQLAYALGVIVPGKVGAEYYLTKGHFHAWRPAAEIYIGLRGEGVMLLEDEAGRGQMAPLVPDSAVYVPGHTAHRTVNTGREPLVYLGVYPADAGHDYGAIAQRNFSQVVVARDGQPALMNRAAFLATVEGA